MVQYRKGRTSPWMVQIRDSSGKVITHSFAKKEDAQAFEMNETRTRQLRKAGMEAPRDNILMIDYAKIFVKRRFKGDLAYSTVKQDESRLRNYWIPKFGAEPLVAITSSRIKEMLDDLQFNLGHAPADRNRHRALMHTLFQEALKDGKVVYNPVTRVPLVQERPKRKKPKRFADPKEAQVYSSCMIQLNPNYGVLAMLMLWTGGRINTCAAIQWGDVNFEEGYVTLCRLLEKASRTIQNRTKGEGEGGQTVVPLFPELRDALLSHRKLSPYIRPTDFIACTSQGAPVPYESYYPMHQKVIEEEKLTPITPHGLRYTFSNTMERAGFSKSEIKELLGHSTIQMTEKYTFKDVAYLLEKAKRLSNSFSVSRVSAKRIGPSRTGGDNES